MGQNLPVRSVRPSAFYPTQPRSGNVSSDTIYRMENMIIYGVHPLTYAQCYAGTLSLSQTIASKDLTGTVAVTSGSTTVTGSGTAFLTELNPGQYVQAVNTSTHVSHLLVVRRIISDTSYICWKAPTASGSGMTATKLPIVFALDQDIATQIFGNTVRTDKGTLLSAGDGVFRLNGSALSASLSVTRAPQISLYNSGAGTYTHFTLGMATSAAPVLTGVAGGTKGMQAGNYSIVILPARSQTLGYNDPSLKATVTLTAGQRVQIQYPAMDTSRGQNGWWVGVTRFADTLGADLNYLEGPWYLYTLSTGSTAGYTENIEWLDAEVERNDLVTFNNDAPPASGFVVILNNVPVWISCQGSNNSSPGPFIFPSKPGNIEAAPADIAFSASPPETILGVMSADGRAYLPTANNLLITQGTPQSDVPVLIRPYWGVGFTGPDQIISVNGRLYGHSVQGPVREGRDGGETSEDLDFALPVSEITDTWNPGHVKVAYDPVTNSVCYIHARDSLNSSGFWTSRILMYGLRQEEWIGNILLTSTTQDMLVCGVATVGAAMQMLIGGRLANDTVSIGTYTFNLPAGSAVPWYVAPPFSDYDSELRDHVVKRVRATYKGTGASVGVFGAGATQSIPVTALEAGNSSSSTGAVSLATATTVTQGAQSQVNVPNISQSTVRVEGSYNGSDTVLDQVHEIVIESATEGIRR